MPKRDLVEDLPPVDSVGKLLPRNITETLFKEQHIKCTTIP